MIEEKYLKMSISIRRTYLKLINNLDLYHNRALKVSSNLEETLAKLDTIQENLDLKDKKTSSKETLDKILNILQEVEDEGKKLETLIDPINVEIENITDAQAIALEAFPNKKGFFFLYITEKFPILKWQKFPNM